MDDITNGRFKNDREIKKDIKNTELQKNKFIDEIKNGLGNKIKNNPNNIKKIIQPKKTLSQKLLHIIKKIFNTI